MTVNRAEFGHHTTAEDVLDGMDLTGKTILITGGSSGLGAEAARVLVAKGAKVTITARNGTKAQPVIDTIKAETPDADITAMDLELGSFEKIRAFAEAFLARGEKLDILINNAGVMACPYAETEDGFELQFGANHLGHFLMTNLIASALKDNARVVSLSSLAHLFSPVLFDDILFKNSTYDKWVSYGQSKTANALFAAGLNKRLASRGIEVFAVHPGGIETNLGRHMTEEDYAFMQPMAEKSGLVMKTIPQGAATEVYAATAPELSGKGGSYLADCAIATMDDDPEIFHERLVRSYALDETLADKLWAISEEMVGQKFRY